MKIRKTAIKVLANHLESNIIMELIEGWEMAGYKKEDCRQVAELYATYEYLTGENLNK